MSFISQLYIVNCVFNHAVGWRRLEVCEFMSQRFIVNRINGVTVCEVEARLDGSCLELKQQVSDYTGVCKCKFKLVAGMHVMRNGLRVRRIMQFIEPGFILHLIQQSIVSTDAKELLVSGVCFKCMKEVGVQAPEIFALLASRTDAAVVLRIAGFSLGDVMRARDQLHLAIQPPVTQRTLFDSQLKAAGFSADDFANAGYRAEQLSYNCFWKDGDETTPGDAEWEDCYAFFTASELRSAGYDASALRHACFSTRDLKEAGFGLLEMREAGYDEEELQIFDGGRRKFRKKPCERSDLIGFDHFSSV